MSERELRVALEVACCAVIAFGAGWFVAVPVGIAVFGVLILLGLNGVGGPR
jgi:hypothetical protein